jgi:RES domain-containing protein
VRVVYASTSLALAAVETFVNLEPNLRPADLVSIEGEIPHAIEIAGIDARMLPAGWHETRDESLRAFGDHWIRGGKSGALLVPSAAIRGEWNILLNPMHPDFSRITFRDRIPFEFDMRMFRSTAGRHSEEGDAEVTNGPLSVPNSQTPSLTEIFNLKTPQPQ